MSYEIPTHFTEQYTTNVEVMLQQRGSKFSAHVSQQHHRGGSGVVVEQIGAVEAQEVVARHADTPLFSTPAERRWVFPRDFDWADLVDHYDQLRTFIDPTSSYAINGAYALGRAQDKVIREAFFGTAKVGRKGTTDRPFQTATQTISVNTGANSATGLNVKKLRAALEILIANDVDLDHEQPVAALSERQHGDLLDEIQVTSMDYNSRPVLADGRVYEFLGIRFIRLAHHQLEADSSGYRRIPLWVPSGMHLGIWNNIDIDIAPRRDKRNAIQVYCKGSFGATRVEEKKVVEIKCRET